MGVIHSLISFFFFFFKKKKTWRCQPIERLNLKCQWLCSSARHLIRAHAMIFIGTKFGVCLRPCGLSERRPWRRPRRRPWRKPWRRPWHRTWRRPQTSDNVKNTKARQQGGHAPVALPGRPLLLPKSRHGCPLAFFASPRLWKGLS